MGAVVEYGLRNLLALKAVFGELCVGQLRQFLEAVRQKSRLLKAGSKIGKALANALQKGQIGR
jgi:hypothetical protein